jgi:hypothetical protein
VDQEMVSVAHRDRLEIGVLQHLLDLQSTLWRSSLVSRMMHQR